MRGFTMFLVVFGHVCNWTLGLADYSPVIPNIFLYFRMPLFFFISGFIAFKPLEFWTKKNFGKRLLNKMQVQLIPTVVFFYVFVSLGYKNWSFPSGYWFTLVLFEMFLFYFSTSLLCKRLPVKFYSCGIILSVVAVFIITYPLEKFHIMTFLEYGKLHQFYPFFVFGILMRKYQNRFLQFISIDGVIATLIVSSTTLLIIFHKIDILASNPMLYSLLLKIEGAMMLVVVFNWFYRLSAFWSRSNNLSRTFRWVGRRTLDIYMLHYFFLFPTMECISKWLIDNDNELLICATATIVTIVVMGMTLFLSSVLRSSKFLAQWLFGVKPNISAA